MRRTIGIVALGLTLAAGNALAQKAPRLNYDAVYCSGNYTSEAVPNDTYVISGEESSPTTVYGGGHYVYINKGADDGVKIGDQFAVMRATNDWTRNPWFASQRTLQRAMGTQWSDLGRIKVVALTPKVATALVTRSCDWFERGDLVRPWVERNAPELQQEKFDRFAPWSGRPLAMVVQAKSFARMAASQDIVYVNLGTSQGVKEGDYFRFFRYQNNNSNAYQIRNIRDRIYGFGAPQNQQRFLPKDLPREILGEGIVLRASDNAATVMITYTLKEVFMGDYVELKEPVAARPMAPAPAPVAAAANRPPTLAVSAERSSVLAGERVRITGRGADPDNDQLRYAWRAAAGQLSGSGTSVQLDTSGLAPGRYAVTGRVEDGRGGVADGSTTITVEAPAAAPQASKIADGFYRAGSSQPDNVLKRILDDVALRLRNDARARALVIGYADSAEEGADQLAGQRAAGAKAYLAGRGVASARVDTRVASGQSGAGRQNRRIDVIWLPEGVSY